MSKRFTDTEKWNDAWFRKLAPKMKLAWIYICDKCDCAGVFKSDFELLSYYIGQKITKDEFEATFADRLEFHAPDKYLITKFILFQYGAVSEKSNVYKGIQKSLTQLTLGIPLAKGMPRDMDKDKDKDKEREYKINEIVNYWNEQAKVLPKVIKLGSRKKQIKARLDECDDFEKWKAAIDMLNTEDYFIGKNPHNWSASFDYLIRPEKFLGLIEKAQNKKPVQKKKYNPSPGVVD